MRTHILAILVPVLVALAAVAALGFWWRTVSPGPLAPRLPDEDAQGLAASQPVNPGADGVLTMGPGVPAESESLRAASWPQFRGPDRDGISKESVKLARAWPEGGPKVVWSLDLGEGYAGAVVRGGRVYLLDYDAAAQADVARCLSLADGSEIWRYAYPVRIKRNHGVSRTVPAVTDEYLVTLGPKCHVVCLDAKSGRLVWAKDLVAQFGATVPEWYAGQCPLIDGDKLILATGGAALLVAVDLATGQVMWKSPNPQGWAMTHASVMPMEYGGRRSYVCCGSGGVAGVAADTGEVLWSTGAWKISIATVASPLVIGGDGRVLLSGGYGAGAMMLRLRAAGSGGQGVEPEVVYRLKPSVFGATQQTPILYQGHVYGVRPDGRLVCLTLEGKTVWASLPGTNFGLGPFLIADGMILLLDDNGQLTLAEATTQGYRQVAQAKVLDGPESWAPMALAGGWLLVRDLKRMVCLDLRGE